VKLVPHEQQTCPKCGKPSASPPAEVYCVDCATEGWEKDAAAHIAVREQQTVVDPRTGVMFPVEEVKDDLLVEIFTELEHREKQYQEWRRMAEDEIIRRRDVALDKAPGLWKVGKLAIEVNRGFSRVWDATELELVVEDLMARGLVRAEDADGLLTEQEPKVDGKKAVDLLNRSEGDALMELRRCFRWKQGRARVKVTPTAHIEP